MHVGQTLTFRRTFIRRSPVRRYQAAAFKEGLRKEGFSAAWQGSNLTAAAPADAPRHNLPRWPPLPHSAPRCSSMVSPVTAREYGTLRPAPVRRRKHVPAAHPATSRDRSRYGPPQVTVCGGSPPPTPRGHRAERQFSGGARRKRSDGVQRGLSCTIRLQAVNRTRSEGGSENASRARNTQRIQRYARLHAPLRGTSYRLRRPRGERVRGRRVRQRPGRSCATG